MPLVAPGGLALGTLCVIDREPRMLSAIQREQLASLAQAALGLIVTRVRRSAADERRLGLLDASLNVARARADQLAALHRYAVSLRGVRSPGDILSATLAAARTVCRTSRAQILDAPLPQLPASDPQLVRVLIRSRQTVEHALVLTRDADVPYTLSERALLEIIADIAGLALEASRAAVG
jgi:GAF domain-containing protein